jgi:hypothetical protein
MNRSRLLGLLLFAGMTTWTCSSNDEATPASGSRMHTAVVAAVAGDDFDALNALVEWTAVTCSNEFEAFVDGALAPGCLAGEPEGTEIEAFPVGGACKTAWLRRDLNPAPISGDLALGRPVHFSGVLPRSGASYLLFAHDDQEETGYALIIEDAKIIGAERTCGSFANMYGPDYEAAVIVE